MPADTTGQDSVPTRQRAEVDWNAGAGGPASAGAPAGRPARPARCSGTSRRKPGA